MKREEAESLFTLAGFQIRRVWELTNGYWPRSYRDLIAESPWWLVLTEIGLVRIGWRKRVIEIEWDAADIRAVVTEDDVTKSETLVHAWSKPKALEYLTALRAAAHAAVTP